MADDSRKDPGTTNVSPYLERPLRSLAQAELDHRMLWRSTRAAGTNQVGKFSDSSPASTATVVILKAARK